MQFAQINDDGLIFAVLDGQPDILTSFPGAVPLPPDHEVLSNTYRSAYDEDWNPIIVPFTPYEEPPPPPPDPRAEELNELVGYLYSTDWLVVRQLETGTNYSDDVKQKRAAARARVSEMRTELAQGEQSNG
jgi:hypothetical protein